MNKSLCSTCAAERRRCGGSRPLLHWKGLLFIARGSRLYHAAPPGAAGRARGIAQAVTRPRPISTVKLKIESQTRGGGRTETKGRSRRGRGENRAAKRAGILGATVDVAATVEVAALRTKQRKGSVHQLQQATSRWRSSSGTCSVPRIRGTDQPWCSHGREDVVWKVGESAT